MCVTYIDRPKSVFRGNQVPDTKAKESQIAWRGRNSSGIDKEWRRRTDSKNMENNY